MRERGKGAEEKRPIEGHNIEVTAIKYTGSF